MAENEQPSNPGDSQDPLAKLAEIYESEPDQPEDEAVADDLDEESQDDDEEVETSEESESEETETDEDVEEDATESEEESEDEQPTTLTIDGEELTVDQVKSRMMFQRDYTQKTQLLAEQRKGFEAQSQNLEATMQALVNAAGADMSRFENINVKQAAIENPDQYKQAKAAYDQTKSTSDFINNQVEQYVQQQKQQHDELIKARSEESITALKASIPNWNNDLYYDIGKYAQSNGVSEEEFNNIVDHRSIQMMHKAMLYDRAKTSAKAKTKKAVKRSPKKTLSSQQSDNSKALNQDTQKKAHERLRKTGHIDDAVAALKSRGYN